MYGYPRLALDWSTPFSLIHCHSLNKTVTELLTNKTISSEEFGNLSVVIEIPPFVEPNSFILQVKINIYIPTSRYIHFR